MIEAGAQTNAKKTTFHMKKKAVLMHRILMSFFRITISPYTVLACARYSDSLFSILSWCQTNRSDVIDEIQTCHLPRKREKVRYFDY